jgi:hypothetical protein
MLILSLLTAAALCATLDELGVVGAPVGAVLAPPEVPPPAPPPVSWVAASARYTLAPAPGGLRVVARYRLDAVEPGWVVAPLLDGRLMLEGASDAISQQGDRWAWVGWLEGSQDVELRGFLPAATASATLQVAPAARQAVEPLVAEGQVLRVEGASAGVLPPTDRLALSWGPAPAPKAEATVAQGRVAVAATVTDDGVEVTARVRWAVRRGELASLALRLPGPADALEVSGPGVLRWRREGDRILIETAEPVDATREVVLRWRLPLVKERATLTVPEPLGVTSAQVVTTLAGDGDRVIAPRALGPRPAALQALPDWARGVGGGAPVAAWTGPGAIELRSLQLEALDGPPLVVDAMTCSQSISTGGRSLLRCQLDVRNASRQFLGVSTPEGWRLWIARVNGDVVAPVLDGETTLVPLERSVETLEGLTTLDLDLVFQAEGEAWSRRGERAVALPALDAPVARLEWSLRLPPGLRGRPTGGTARPPEAAAGEIVYGFTSSQTRTLWSDALDAYQSNRFEEAQVYLDELLEQDGGYENAVKLQANLDVLMGGAEVSAAEEAQARRVKDLARAKVAEAEAGQRDKLAEVERKLRSGDVESALKELEALESENRMLSYTEQAEEATSGYVDEQLKSYKAEASRQLEERSGAGLDALAGKKSKASPSKRSGNSGSFGSGGGGDSSIDPGFDSDNDGLGDAVAFGPDRPLPDRDEPPPPPVGVDMDPAELPGAITEALKGENKEDRKVTYRQRAEIDFEDLDISGELIKPDGALLLDGKLAPPTVAVELEAAPPEPEPEPASSAAPASVPAPVNAPAPPPPPPPPPFVAAERQRASEASNTVDFATAGPDPRYEAEIPGPEDLRLNEAPTPVMPRQGFAMGGELGVADEELLEGEEPLWAEDQQLIQRDYIQLSPEELVDEPSLDELLAGQREIAVEETTRGEVLTREMLERIPTGRSYQSAVSAAPGVVGSATASSQSELMHPYRVSRSGDGETEATVVRDPITGTAIEEGTGEGGAEGGEAAPVDVELMLARRDATWPDLSGLRLPRWPDAWRKPPPPSWPTPERPTLGATTFAIPLPEHGEAVALSQRLLAPGEQPEVTIKYREKRR